MKHAAFVQHEQFRRYIGLLGLRFRVSRYGV